MGPRGLFDAFYFQGEPLDGKMIEGVSTISVSLSDFLHIDQWEEAAEALAKVHQHYEKQLHTVASANRARKEAKAAEPKGNAAAQRVEVQRAIEITTRTHAWRATESERDACFQ